MKTPVIALLGAMGLLAITNDAWAAGTWCEANCKALCIKIYGRAGAADCFARIPCSNYAGKACASAAVVNARAIVYCHSHPGTGVCK